MKILYFSRGRGHGHAVPDAGVIQALERQRPDLEIRAVSYGTGRATLERLGVPAADLELPDDNGFVPTWFRARDLIEHVRPDAVVAHEEFAAVPAARQCGVPAVFVADWLPAPGSILLEAIGCAASILIKEAPGLFPVAPEIADRTRFCGPLFRTMRYSAADRDVVRRALGIDPAAVVMAVIAGGWLSESRAPLVDLILAAFAKLPANRQLLWISDADFDTMKRRLADVPGATAMPFIDPVERVMVASDVLVTKGTRCTLADSCALGIPSISLSSRSNPVDEVYVPRIRSNIALNADAVTPDILACHLLSVLAAGRRRPATPPMGGEDRFARVLLAELDRCLAASEAVGTVTV